MEARTDPGAGAGATSTASRPRRRRVGWRLTIAIAAVVGAAAATVWRWSEGQTSFVLQVFCLLAAVVAVIALGECRAPAPASRRALLAGAVLLAVGGALRLAAHEFLPPPDQTAFEEIQTGGTAYRFLHRGKLPLEFRFSTLLAAAGFAVGGNGLGAMRAPFKLAGLLILLLLLLTLRRLEVSWPGAALAVTVAATMRWLVIAAGCADEMFAPMVWVAAVIWLLAADDRAGGPSSAASGVLGVLCGVLLFEHAAYLPVVALAGVWLAWCAASSGRKRQGMRAWAAPALFLVAMLTTALPVVVDLGNRQRQGAVLEPLRRHTSGRASPLAEGAPERARRYLVALCGGPIRGDDGLAVVGQPAIPRPLGILIGTTALVSLLAARRRRLPPAIVVTAATGVLIAAAVAANLNVARMSGLLVMLLVPLGWALDGAVSGAAQLLCSVRAARGVITAPLMRAVLAGTLGCWLVAANLASVRALAADSGGRAMYIRDEYAISTFIARIATPGQTVVLWTPETDKGWAAVEETEMIWLLQPKRLNIVGVTELPAPESVAAGTLVVVGVQERALRGEELRLLGELADATGSRHTLTTADNLAGLRSVAAVCVRCR